MQPCVSPFGDVIQSCISCRGDTGASVFHALDHFHSKPTASPMGPTVQVGSGDACMGSVDDHCRFCYGVSHSFSFRFGCPSQIQRMLHSALDDAPVEELARSLMQV